MIANPLPSPTPAAPQARLPGQRTSNYRPADKLSLYVRLFGFMFLAALLGAALPILGLFLVLMVILAGISIWVMLDFRAGVGMAVVLMPLSALSMFPHELFGIRGLNPLNVILFLTLVSYVVHAGLRRWHDRLVPLRLLTWYILPIGVAAVIGMSSVGMIPPHFHQMNLIQFTDAAGYIRDMFLKPQSLVFLALMVALAVRHSKKPERFVYLMLLSGWIFCALVAFLMVRSGVSLRELASPLARTFLGALGMHANELSMLLNMLYAITLFSIHGQAGMLRKKLFFVSAVVFALAVLMTFSRGGFLGFVLVNAVYFWKRISIKTVVIACIVAAVIGPFVIDAVMERALTGVDRGDRAAVTAGRIDGIWLPLLSHVLEEPVLPHGIRSILWSDPVRMNRMLPVAQPHSAWLGGLMDFGLIGFGFMLAFLLFVRSEFVRFAREHPSPPMQGIFAGAAVTIPVWFVQGMTDDYFTPAFSQAYFWISLGILIGCGGLYRDGKKQQQRRVAPT